jgi:hypothetical protein
LRFLKSIGWYGFSNGLMVVLNVFHQGFDKKIHKAVLLKAPSVQNRFPIFLQNSKDDISASEN